MKDLVQRVIERNTKFMRNAINNLQSLLESNENVFEKYLMMYRSVLETVLKIIRESETPEEAYRKIKHGLLHRRSKELYDITLIVLGSLFCASKEIINRLAKEFGIREDMVVKANLCGEDSVCDEDIRRLYTLMSDHYPFLCGGWDRLKRLTSLDVRHPIWDNLLILAARGSLSAKLGNLLEELLAKVLVKHGVLQEHIQIETKNIKVLGRKFVSPRKIDIIVRDQQNVPRVLGMVTYQMTTSSGQTAKGLAEHDFVNFKKELIESFGEPVYLVCFVDGIGWIARGESDIERNISHCDDVFTFDIDEVKRFIDLVLSVYKSSKSRRMTLV